MQSALERAAGSRLARGGLTTYFNIAICRERVLMEKMCFGNETSCQQRENKGFKLKTISHENSTPASHK